MKLFFNIFILFLFIGCNQKHKETVAGTINKKQEPVQFTIPESLQSHGDVLIDTLFLSIPSEGSIVKVYKREDSAKLFRIDAIATMNKYSYEILSYVDSSIIKKTTQKYDKPLTVQNVKLKSTNEEFFKLKKDKLSLYVRNDSIIENREINTKIEKNVLDLVKQINHKISQTQ